MACSTRAPVGALEQDQEVIPAHVAEKVARRLTRRGQHGGGHLQHLVALPIAVLVIEGLEVIQVHIAGVELRTGFQQTFNVQVQRNVARQERERVGIARRFDADFGDGAHEFFARAQAQVAAVLGDDETVGQVALVFAHRQR